MTYIVDVTREGDHWVGDVRDVPGAHTYARTLDALLRGAREVIILMDDEAALPEDAAVDMTLAFPEDAMLGEAAEIAKLRERVAAQDVEVQRRTAEEARALTEAGYSVRDAATALGVSPGRISQLNRT